jgi:hypothetical protein
MPRAGALVVLLGLLTGLTPEARAQGASSMSSAAACPSGNLLAGKLPSSWADIRGKLALATDGVVAPEGAIWDAPLAVVLDTAASTLTWDLGALTNVNAAWIQADANDYYTVWGSVDGQSWRDLGRIDTVEGHGLRGRKLGLGGAAVRFIRFGEGQGDNYYSLSEIQVFCELPSQFPPPMRVENAPAATVAKNIFTYWNDETSARWELVLALLGFALLQWGFMLRRDGDPDRYKRLRNWLLASLGVLGGLTYVNFGFAHFGNYIHDWEWTHYYVGSKYFSELSYDRLYECIATADAEDGLRRRVELRTLTNLHTNVIEKTKEILEHPERCKQHFTPERWQDFKHDVKFFRDRQSAKRWDDLQLDHGYNATPVWNIAGTLLANTAPASKTQLYILALLDPLYLLATIAIIWWAFGWRVLSVGLVVFATNFPSRFYWTGGSFLRWDWLFYLVAAVCLLRKDRPRLAGAALAYSTLLRVFPMFIFLGPGLALGWHFWKHRRLERRYLNFFAGAAVAVALLMPLSLGVSGGVTAYKQFVHNTNKHKETPLTNYVGLRTVMAWRPSTVGRHVKDNSLVDPWSKWKQARLDGFKQAKPAYVVIVLAFLVLLGLSVRHVEPWAAAALGVTFIPVGVELTSYYYAFILAVALLYEKREQVGRWLLLLTGFTQFVAWAPIKNMSSWLDEQYTLMSAATVGVFGAIVWLFREPEAAPEPGQDAPEAKEGGAEAPKAEGKSGGDGLSSSRGPGRKKKKRR